MDPSNCKNSGRCISCGFASKRSLAFDGPRYAEISEDDRSIPEMRQFYVANQVGKHTSQSYEIACFRGAANLQTEINEVIRASDRQCSVHDARREVLGRDRHCERWIQHTPTFSPKEHAEEQRMLESERRTKELMEWLERTRLEYLESQSEANREFAKKEGKINRKYTAITIGIGIAIVSLNILNRCTPVQQIKIEYPPGVSQPVQQTP